jgi:type II secretory pathway component PulJ
MMHSRPPRDRGYLLTEVMFTLALLTVCLVLAARVFYVSMKLIGRTAEASTQVAQASGLLGNLQRDIWEARTLRVLDVTTLELDLPDEGRVLWQARPGEAVIRQTAATQKWAGFTVAFAAHRTGVAISQPGLAQDAPILYLNRDLARGGRP